MEPDVILITPPLQVGDGKGQTGVQCRVHGPLQSGWADGQEEPEETASVVMPQGLGAGGGLGQGREQETLL